MTRLLLVGGQDGYNHTLPPLAREARRRGWDVTVLIQREGTDHEHMFADLRRADPAIAFHFYNAETFDASAYDVAIGENLGTPALRDALTEAGVVRLTMAFHIVPREYVMGPAVMDADAVCVLAESFAESQRAHGLRQNFLVTGSPQYDHLDPSQPPSTTDILFLEQHFYPAGTEGKSQLAKMLLEAARRHPDRRLVVKPRSLPSEADNASHQAEHVYDYVRRFADPMPENLVLLERHEDLVSLVQRSAIVATTFSTALIPAVYLGRPVLFVEGFSCIDAEYYNSVSLASYYEKLRDTGGIVPYTAFAEALDHPPTPNKEALTRHFGAFDGKASAHILDAATALLKDRGAPDPTTLVRQKIDVGIAQAMENLYRVRMRAAYAFQDIADHVRGALLKARDEADHRLEAGEDPNTVRDEVLFDLFLHGKAGIEMMAARGLENPQDHTPSFLGWLISHLVATGQADMLPDLPAAFDGPDRDLAMARWAAGKGDNATALEHMDRFLDVARRTPYRLTPALYIQTVMEAEFTWVKLSAKNQGSVLSSPASPRSPLKAGLASLGCGALVRETMNDLAGDPEAWANAEPLLQSVFNTLQPKMQEDILRAVLHNHPDAPGPHGMLASVLRAQGRAKEATEHLFKALGS